MALPILIALLALWGTATVLAVSLCIAAGRCSAERRPHLRLVGSR
jgi:hypothetical protein